jgi:hypothetical protein
MQEKGGEQRLKGEQIAAQAKQADAARRAPTRQATRRRDEDRVAAQDAHWQRMDEILRRKVEGSEKFAFKPSIRRSSPRGIAARMQVIDNASGKKKDHEATSDAIGLASQVVRGSGGQIGLDEAVGLVANPDIWLTKEDAQKQAQRDYSRGSNTFGGFEVKDDKGKVVKKLSKDEYVKQRAQELIDENRQEVRDRVEKYTGGGSVKTPQPIAARGLPTGSRRRLPPHRRAVDHSRRRRNQSSTTPCNKWRKSGLTLRGRRTIWGSRRRSRRRFDAATSTGARTKHPGNGTRRCVARLRSALGQALGNALTACAARGKCRRRLEHSGDRA